MDVTGRTNEGNTMPLKPIQGVRTLLSLVGPNPQLSIGPQVLQPVADLAALAMEQIAIVSMIDSQWDRLLCDVLDRGQQPLMMKVMGTLRSGKSGLIRELVSDAFPTDPEAMTVFNKVAASDDTTHAFRNYFAHWIWAACPRRPQDLCLINPAYMAAWEGNNYIGHLESIDPAQVFVFDETELRARLAEAKESLDDVRLLRQALGRSGGQREARDELLR
jgi:hypothetical protein